MWTDIVYCGVEYYYLCFLCIAGTPFEGGQFKMKLVLGKDYPTAPPQGE